MSVLDFTKSSLVMGILNVTPDSFSGDGLMQQGDYVNAAVAAAEQMIKDGAHILDIGGESSRPGAEPVGSQEELRRVVPVIEAIRKKFGVEPVMAVDTVKASVADAALNAGATIINDISALQADADMAAVAVKHKAIVVLMHNRSKRLAFLSDAKLGGEYQAPVYGDVVEDVKKVLSECVQFAISAGIAGEKIILDPGIGFGKTPEQNLKLINHLDRIKALGFPVMIGPSRKSFIGRVLDTVIEDRLEGTAAAVAASVLRGADIVRIHDVRFMAQVIRMAAAIARN